MSTSNIATNAAEGLVPSDLVNAFIELVSASGLPENEPSGSSGASAARPGVNQLRWLRPTMDGICGLPWNDPNLPDGRKPLEKLAVARLLWLLCEVLDKDTIPPTSINPTWRGGVAAEWHVNGMDLEIEADPGGALEYNIAGLGIEEYEGPVEEGLDNLREHVKLLPGERE